MEEKRKSQRVEKSIKCEVHSDGMTFSSTIDISEGGMFISTPEPLIEDAEVDLILHIPDEDMMDVQGRVRWIRDEDDETLRAGMGIEFLGLTDKQKEIIKRFVDE